MPVDKSNARLGLLKWPLLVAMVLGQLYMTFLPPPEIGSVIMVAVKATAIASQNTVNVARGGNWLPAEDVKTVELLAVVPMAIAFVFVFYSLRVAISFCIRPFVGGASESSQEKASKAGGQAKSFDAQRDDNAHKFGECALRVLYYAPMFFVAIYLADLESYWPDLENCWRDVRNGQPRPLELECAYMVELAYYTSGIFIHIFIDQPLKDYWVMLFHHIVTMVLLGWSYEMGYHRIGVLVLICHDISDVFLDSAKCFHYIDMEIFSTLTFVNLVISWALYRLWYFPTRVISSTIWNVIAEEERQGVIFPYANHFRALLCLLLVLHVYWFFLILKVAQRAVTEGIEDVRDEDAMARGKKTK